jgi:hypothetical protein
MPTMTYFITMKTESRTRMRMLLGFMVKEGERGKFQKIEWLKKCEMDWSLAKEMGQDQWTCALGLHSMAVGLRGPRTNSP